MTKVYVSYRRHEHEFIRAVVSYLAPQHEMLIDMNLPDGVDFRDYQADWLRAADVFLLFVSEGTRTSDYQNSEIGAARFWSRFVDGKMIVPVRLGDAPLPRPIEDLNYLPIAERDPKAAADAIRGAIAKRLARVRLFISHAHRDEDLASRLVDVITSNLEVPAGELRCTSVPGYQLELGVMAPEALRRELGTAACVVGLLTPNSIGTEWVLFELGAAWANAKVAIPLLAGKLEDRDIPGPFRGAAGGQLKDAVTLDRLLDQLQRELGWVRRSDLSARQKQYDLVGYAQKKVFTSDPLEQELKASYAARRARVGATQGRLLDYVTARLRERPYVPFDEITRSFSTVQTSLFYRLEQLRLLGFLSRVAIDENAADPAYGWTLSEKYRRELGL
jgi:hypothetical protein